MNRLGRKAVVFIAPLMLIPWVASAKSHIMPTRFPEQVQAAALPSNAHLSYYGGRVVSNLEVVQVLWGSGNYLPQVSSTGPATMASFYTNVLKSPYVDWLSEYNTQYSGGTRQNIGRGSFLGQYTITPSVTSAALTDDQITAELSAQILAGRLPYPSTDAAGNTNTYYAVFFPNGKTVTLGSSTSCQNFCAYHGTVAKSGARPQYYYGVHPDFQSGTGCDTGCGPSSRTFDNLTGAASHIMVETITDPEVGLSDFLTAPIAWYDENYGEIADICGSEQGTISTADGQSYTVHKQYSNALHSCIVAKEIPPPDFQATVSPSNMIASPGQSVDYALTFSSTNIFNETLYMSCAGGPSQSKCKTPNQTNFTGSASVVARLTIPATALPGVYKVTLKGRIGSISRFAYATVTIN